MTTFEYASIIADGETLLTNTTGEGGADLDEAMANAGAGGWDAFGFTVVPPTMLFVGFKRPTGTI